MHVRPITRTVELAPLAEAWNALAGGVPFRRFEWLDTWWRHYGRNEEGGNSRFGTSPPSRRPLDGPGAELLVLAVFDETSATLVGLAPWFIAPGRSLGRVIRFLGSGEVCSDHLSVMALHGHEAEVAAALADWLNGPGSGAWDALELTGVAKDDAVVPCLLRNFRARGNTTHQRPGEPCWRLPLPGSWDEYLARLSKSHRKQVRRAVRKYFDCGQAVLHTASQAAELPSAFAEFVDLHQRRRNSLGEHGCFSSERFAGFLKEATHRLHADHRVRLNRLMFGGQTVAADYLLVEGGAMFVYQGGLDPDRLPLGPGRLLAIAEIRQAIEQGFTAIDFLRGNEPFKAHWRAVPNTTVDYRVAAGGIASRLRHGIWLSKQQARHWARQGMLLADVRGLALSRSGALRH